MANPVRRMVTVVATVGVMLIYLLVLLLSPSGVAEASFCSPHGDSLQNAPIVFSGRAVSIKLEIHDPQQRFRPAADELHLPTMLVDGEMRA